MLAADAGHHELIEQLLEIGASVRAEDRQGRTALSRACEAGHVRAAKALTDGGAEICHRDHRGLTCKQLAADNNPPIVLELLSETAVMEEDSTDGATAGGELKHERPRKISKELHRLLCEAGFTQHRAVCQQRLADLLEEGSRALTQEDRQMTGSFAEGWANSLVQVNGRTGADSDIDWTVLVPGQTFHLKGACVNSTACRHARLLAVNEGHAQVDVGSGSQPAITAPACGVRPTQDTCRAIQCCSGYFKYRIHILPKYFLTPVHLVSATRPDSSNELRVSFSFHERQIMRNLSTVQGQLFTMIKFIFKKYLPINMSTPGLKTYHAKTLLFFMLKKHAYFDSITQLWKPEHLAILLRGSLDMMLSFIDSSDSPHVCMPHFFMADAPLYFKNAGLGGEFDNTKARVRHQLALLRQDFSGVVTQLRQLVKPLQSPNFYFHPFTLLQTESIATQKALGPAPERHQRLFAAYAVIDDCLFELQKQSASKEALTRLLESINLVWCKCAYVCIKTMMHLKFGEPMLALSDVTALRNVTVKRGWKPAEILNPEEFPQLKFDWAWRFCFPCDTQPCFPFLPEFTQTLFTARLSQPRSAHVYVNFNCLSWSLQAELLKTDASINFDAWLEELREDPDLEELLTMAQYSNCPDHLWFCLQQIQAIKDERRIVMETQDEDKIQLVVDKLHRLLSRKSASPNQRQSEVANHVPTALDVCTHL
ncbi:hypothetical protein BOX15_Mlig014288g1 [Macrostomum lignano]|uniref:Uncharacterized protein n=1 Tax=Macrostomum lignano TaxID=282301 RepID=A0A267FHQ1_9PLAT|nr:hypothetical protein BOX15_Mlig014288g1 [Macrostomum lignano]